MKRASREYRSAAERLLPSPVWGTGYRLWRYRHDPLYTLKTAFEILGGDATPDRILGMLSLLLWTLFLITSIKYVVIAMSIDNEGEGGILALMSLLGVQLRHRPPHNPGGPSRCCADLRRWRHYAGHFRALSA